MKELTIIIPAFNEETRLPPFLSSLASYLQQHLGHNFEIIVIDDGSKDATGQVSEKILHPHFGRVISLPSNRGKGYAIKYGIQNCKGKYVCITDADGSASISNFIAAYLIVKNENLPGLIGTRYSRTEVTASRLSLGRKLLGKIFAFTARFILNLNYSDTQCGFKIFKTSVIKPIAAQCKLDRFSIDFEMLFVASQMNITFLEFPVIWREKPGSKVNVFKDGIRMIAEMIRVRVTFKEKLNTSSPLIGSQEKLTFLNSSTASQKNNALDEKNRKEEHRVSPPKAS